MLAACLATLVLPGMVQAEPWEYTTSFYLWGSGLDTSVETPLGTVEAELSFSDLLENLNFALFAMVEARNGPWTLMGDLNYTDLGATLPTPGPIFSGADVDTTLTIFTGYGAYAFVDRPDLRLELGAGLRYYSLDLVTRVLGGVAPGGRTFTGSDSWVDPIIGVQASAPLSEKWFARGYADIGGFGIGDASEESWQIYVGGGYEINDIWAVQFGYRHLSIDKELDNLNLKMDQAGPLVGLSARF